MEDTEIIKLFWNRSERAIQETERKYGGYCMGIAMRILCSTEDSKEVVNDTMLAAWENIPPHRPAVYRTYLGKIARNLSLKRWRYKSARKRGLGEFDLALEEISSCASASNGRDLIEELEVKELVGIIERFLKKQRALDRKVFVCRYFYFESIQEISGRLGCTESRTKSILFRMRKKLRKELMKEGYYED